MTLTLDFLGAADTVTGSRTLVGYRGRQWLIDCGLFQGPPAIRERNWQPFAPDPSALSGVILTHAHLDHSGFLPRLSKEGFTGPVLATSGTAAFSRILLMDAAKLEEESARFANEKGYSRHKPALPLFTEDDAWRALALFETRPRHEWLPLADGLALRFLRAGHIIGSSLVQLMAETSDGPRVITFSGDLGNGRSQVLRPPESFGETDVLVVEGTYGLRHQPRVGALAALAQVIRRTFARGGVVMIPAFAVGRAQEITYMLRLLEDQGAIPRVPVILDSPMAAAAMEVCLAHGEDQILDSAFLGAGDPFRPHRFEVASSPDQSMLACMRDGPMIVISASGMLSGGRILHHLKHRLPDPRHTVLFAGYQAEGSKGRYLQEQGALSGSMRIFKEEVAVHAEIVTMDHLSSHADADDVLQWMERSRRLPTRVLINHGEPDAQAALAAKIRDRFGITATPAASERRHRFWG